ncbi:MAG: hypothetical protein LBC17_04105 [Lactobacillaceae bacterium]|jgi:hypothetical protein|nr:hypothetical protein [Lactobacillaceae bacterium]
MLKNEKISNILSMAMLFILSSLFAMSVFNRPEMSAQLAQLKELFAKNINVILVLSVVTGITVSILLLVEYYIGKMLLYVFFKNVKAEFSPYIMSKSLAIIVNTSLLSAFHIYNPLIFAIIAVIASILAIFFHFTNSNKFLPSLVFVSPLIVDSVFSLVKVLIK